MCKEIFDFGAIRRLITGSGGKPRFEVMANALNGGNYRLTSIYEISASFFKQLTSGIFVRMV
jgi:hypothetical protein